MTHTDSMTITRTMSCGNCAYYMTDEDECGNLTDFYHNRNQADGFCVMQELFYTVTNNDKACSDWVHDGLMPE